jgi:hypothetical protein
LLPLLGFSFFLHKIQYVTSVIFFISLVKISYKTRANLFLAFYLLTAFEIIFKDLVMRFFTLLNVVFWGLACAHTVTASPISGSPNSCAEYSNTQETVACNVTGNFDLAAVNQDLKVIYGSSGTLSVVQPDAIIAPSLDTSVVDLKHIEGAHNARTRMKNLRPKLRPDNNTSFASRIFPNKMDDIEALNTLIEEPSTWKQVASSLFGRKLDQGFCVDYLSLILVKS